MTETPGFSDPTLHPAYDNFGHPLHPFQDLPPEYMPFAALPDVCGLSTRSDPAPDLISQQWRSTDLEFARRIADAQVFDFGVGSVIMQGGSRIPYIMELFAREFIDTPFPTVIFRLGPQGSRMCLVVDSLRVARPMYVRHYRIPLYLQDRSSEGLFVLIGAAFISFTITDPIACADGEPAISLDFMPSRALYENKFQVKFDQTGRKKEAGFASIVSQLFLYCSLILSTDGVPRRVQKASQLINAERVRKGRPRVPTVTHIDFRVYDSAENAPPGHHASPLPHLRRGHIRRLQDGRRVWVRDCLVNASADMDTMRRTRYQVDTDAAAAVQADAEAAAAGDTAQDDKQGVA